MKNKLCNIDLAVECSEVRGLPRGATVEKEHNGSEEITTITVSTAEASEKMGKPIGKYVTIEFAREPSDSSELVKTAKTLADCLLKLIPKEGSLLFCGLGNRNITPDSLGPVAARNVFATRHLPTRLADLPPLRPVSAVAPGVLSQTGVETAELIAGLVAKLRPAAVVTVDALAARRMSRLCKTIQLSDSGITPGSGVGNSRAALNRQTLGCEVISVGVPLVVDGLTLSLDLMGIDHSRRAEYETASPQAANLMVTPQNIDKTAENLGKLIGLAFNMAAQPLLDAQLLMSIV